MAHSRIDLNSADLTTLIQKSGLATRKAELLIERRPFWDFSELRQLPGFGPKTLERLAAVATVIPPPPTNINSCDLDELTSLPGVGPALARRIAAERPFTDLEDLIRVRGVGEALLAKLHRRVEALHPPVLDVNLASAGELLRLPGIGKARAHRIIGARPFDDLAHMAAELRLSPAVRARLTPLVTFGPSQDISPPAEEVSPGDFPDASADKTQDEIETAPPEAVGEAPAAAELGIAEELPLPRLEATEDQGAGRPDFGRKPTAAEVLAENEWVVVGDRYPLEAESTVSLVQAPSVTLSLAEHNAIVKREIARRMPIFFAGWLVAAAVLIGLIFLYALDLIAIGSRETTVQAAEPTLSAPDLDATVQSAIAATQASIPTLTATPLPEPTESLLTLTPEVVEITSTPVPEYLMPLANLGPQIFTELFAPGDFWELGTSDIARIEIELERLTITMLTRGAIAWTRNGFADSDFYYQGTVLSEGCQSGDYYGLVFRSVDDLNLYLFGVSCSGQYRIVRRLNGQFSTLLDFTPMPGIHPGDALNLLGVRAHGSELHFYVNDQYVVGLTDSSMSEGRFGVFAKTFTNPDLSVHFDDLAAWSVDP